MPPKQLGSNGSSKATKSAKNSADKERDSQIRATALHHARLIQEQKDIQNRILDTIIELLDLPTASTADPTTPSTKDRSDFKHGLAPFQQRDYDDLVMERNIADKCGYPLCPRANKKDPTKATQRIIWGKKGESLRVVPKNELDRWCSEQCAERSIFVRAQLNENPAWVVGERKEEILLLDEVNVQRDPEAPGSQAAEVPDVATEIPKGASNSLVDGIRQLAIRDGLKAEEEEALRRIQQLVLERGKKSITPAGVSTLENVDLVEKKPSGIAQPPDARGTGESGTVEGYRPRARANDKTDDDDDGRDILDL